MEITIGMIIPVPITFHVKSNGGQQGIRAGVLVSRVPGPVIRSKGLMSDDTILEGAMSEIGVVLKGHDDGDDDEDSSWTTNFFYPPRSCTIPKVV